MDSSNIKPGVESPILAGWLIHSSIVLRRLVFMGLEVFSVRLLEYGTTKRDC
jgi:hypothetical protein